MTENTDWIKPGADAALYRSGSFGSVPTVRPVTIASLTKTQIVLTSGRRFRIKDRKEVGADVYRSDLLIAADDPRVAQAAELRRVADLKSAALSAVDGWRRGAGGSKELARTAASALLAYANDLPPLP